MVKEYTTEQLKKFMVATVEIAERVTIKKSHDYMKLNSSIVNSVRIVSINDFMKGLSIGSFFMTCDSMFNSTFNDVSIDSNELKEFRNSLEEKSSHFICSMIDKMLYG